MSPGIKASAGLFVVALPVMLYLTAPGSSVKAPLPVGSRAVGLVTEPVSPVGSRAPQPALQPVPAAQAPVVAHSAGVVAVEQQAEPRAPGQAHAAGTEARETEAEPVRDARHNAGEGPTTHATASHPARLAYRQAPPGPALVPTRDISIIGAPATPATRVGATLAPAEAVGDAFTSAEATEIAGSPDAGPVAEEVAAVSDGYEYLPTALPDDGAQVNTVTPAPPVDCAQVLYMGGNAYGRNMLVRMGCTNL